MFHNTNVDNLKALYEMNYVVIIVLCSRGVERIRGI